MAFYLKLATALCLARAVLSDPRVPLSAFSSTYAGRCRAVRKDLGGTLSIRYRAFGPRSLRLVKSVGDETFRLAARGASPRKVMVGGRLWFSRTFRDSEAVIENLVAEDTGQYWCFYSGRESGFDLSLDQRGTGLVLLVVAGPPPSQHSRTASGGERDLRRRAAAGKRHRHRAPRVDHPRGSRVVRMVCVCVRARQPDAVIYEDMRPTIVP